jgi:hypothetical protein
MPLKQVCVWVSSLPAKPQGRCRSPIEIYNVALTLMRRGRHARKRRLYTATHFRPLSWMCVNAREDVDLLCGMCLAPTNVNSNPVTVRDSMAAAAKSHIAAGRNHAVLVTCALCD